jgi:hypothetical protein
MFKTDRKMHFHTDQNDSLHFPSNKFVGVIVEVVNVPNPLYTLYYKVRWIADKRPPSDHTMYAWADEFTRLVK